MKSMTETFTSQPTYEDFRQSDRLNSYDWRDPGFNRELLAFQNFAVSEAEHNPTIGMTAIVGTFGDRFSGARALTQAIETHLALMKKPAEIQSEKISLKRVVSKQTTGVDDSIRVRFFPFKSPLVPGWCKKRLPKPIFPLMQSIVYISPQVLRPHLYWPIILPN